MLIPLEQPIQMRVVVIRAVPSPAIRMGTLIWYDGRTFRIQTPEEETELKPGDTVVLDFGSQGPSRCRSRVESVDGSTFELMPKEALQRRDRRDHPRVAAELPFEYRPLSPLEGEPARRAGLAVRAHLASADQNFRAPDPFVDISGTGLRFIDNSPPEANTLLLVRLRFEAGRPWLGAVARVVRVEEEVPGEFSVATTFTDLGPRTLDALLDFIARRQEALLGMLSPRS